MIETKFQDKIALVTGSGRGIGRTIALHLADLGANLVINYHRNETPAQEVADLVRQKGRRAIVVKANLSKTEDIELLFKSVEGEFGGLDIFISNAASGFNRPAMMQKVTGWDWTMDVNARAFLFSAQLAVPLMETRGGGHMVAISSPGSHRVLPDYISVGASKAALEALTRYLAVELAPRNIRVNAVSPGIVLTDALQHFSALSHAETIPNAIRNTPAGRLVTPKDVAGVVEFLCSPAAAMIVGQILILDGGYTLIVPGQ
jgi:enoyl-[acyl-carrier protein] reductase III